MIFAFLVTSPHPRYRIDHEHTLQSPFPCMHSYNTTKSGRFQDVLSNRCLIIDVQSSLTPFEQILAPLTDHATK